MRNTLQQLAANVLKTSGLTNRLAKGLVKGLATALGSLLVSLNLQASTPEPIFDKEAFIEEMVRDHQFSADEIRTKLNNLQPNPQILEAISRPWEAKPWHQYHPIFLTDKRTEKGVAFWEQHAETLQRAEAELGVPAEIIVAIIGVETYYGGYKGKYGVLDALNTLGFYFEPRAKFFRKELKEYFILSREEGFNVTELKGSYAGAMGWGQFISSSYRHYAIDFDGDGVRDLLNNPVDAIGSVANYFRKHGWQTGQPVAFPLKNTNAAPQSHSKLQDQGLVSKALPLEHTWQDIQQAGFALNHPAAASVTLKPDVQSKLLAFKQPDSYEYWVALHNFYVITRYNHSPLYAMAVYQLSQNIKAKKLAR